MIFSSLQYRCVWLKLIFCHHFQPKMIQSTYLLTVLFNPWSSLPRIFTLKFIKPCLWHRRNLFSRQQRQLFLNMFVHLLEGKRRILQVFCTQFILQFGSLTLQKRQATRILFVQFVALRYLIFSFLTIVSNLF